MKWIIKSIFIGVLAALIGCIISVFLEELVLDGSSKEVGSIYAWGVFLTVLISVCTGVIVSQINKRQPLS